MQRGNAAVLGAFALELVVCLAAGVPTWAGLLIGLVIFLVRGHHRGFTGRELARMCVSGVSTARGILVTFVFIGALTALWRASGTIAQIVIMAAPYMTAATAPIVTFALTGAVSFLMGTSFGTAATMGVVCMAVARSLGADPFVIGGAILSGAYFGDRVSPLSTSALLVRTVTQTDLGRSMRAMMRSAAVPLAAACAFYVAWGMLGPVAAAPARAAHAAGAVELLRGYFDQGVVALVPAVLVLVLPLLRVHVRGAMGASIAAAALVCIVARGATAAEVLQWSLFGYRADAASVGALMNGGGVLSMVNVAVIVCLSSSYAGLLDGTGLLAGVQEAVAVLARRTSPFAAVLAVALPASMVACNQTLAIMLSHRLCAGVERDRYALALDLEDSAVVVSPLVPWSVACTAVASMCGASASCFAAAVYLWFIPLWRLGLSLAPWRRERPASAPAIRAGVR